MGANLYADGYAGRARMVVASIMVSYSASRSSVPAGSELLHSATIAVAGQVPSRQALDAVPCFPAISEVWLRLWSRTAGRQPTRTRKMRPADASARLNTTRARPEPSIGLRITLSTYKTASPGCTSPTAAPPGPGAHGMCGANAADVRNSVNH